jgi:hypothetical protein
MARVLYAPTITEFRGSVGGVTFQRNANGAIAKLKNSQKFSLSTAQSITSSNLSRVASLWSTIGSGAQASWNAFALAHSRTDFYGRVKNLSGFQWFCSCNLNLITIGEPLLSNAPTYVSPGSLSNPVIGPSGSSLLLNLDSPGPSSGYALVGFVTPPTGSSSLLSRVQKKLIVVYKSTPINSIDLTSEYLTLFGIDWETFADTNHLFVQSNCFTVALPSGISSPYQSAITEWP